MLSRASEAHDHHLRDEAADHLAGSRGTAAIRRDQRRAATKERTLTAIQAHGNGYSSASAALRSAAERNFGSWAKACAAAGLEAPKRGRPPGNGVKLHPHGNGVPLHI